MRFFGNVGYEIAVDNGDGTWTVPDEPIEREYYGDVTRNLRRYEGTEKVNEDLTLSNSFSIVADPFAFENFMHIRYIEWMGRKWKVSNVEIQPPRLLLTVGGMYNG